MLLSLWAFALGVYGVAFWPALPAAPWLALTLPALLCLARPSLRPVAALVLGYVFGWAWGLMQLDHRLALEQDKTDYRVTGVVRGLPDHDQRRVRFLFDVDTIESLAGGPAPDLSRLRISWYAPVQPQPGQRWQLRVRLRAPRSFVNPGGFDYARWLLGEGISATGYVRQSGANQRLGEAHCCWFDRWRWSLRENIRTLAAASEAKGFMAALVLGDKSAISPGAWRSLVASGTVHLLVVSGLHIGMVAGIGFFLGCGLGRLAAGVGLPLPANQVGALIGLLAAISYGLLAGFGLAVVRALVMTGVVMAAILARRRTGVWSGFGLALAFLALIDPLAATRAGFWLSFTAVAGLLAWFVPRPEGGRAQRLAAAQPVVFVALIAALVVFQGRVPLLAPLVNLVAIPWVSLGIVPLCLLGIPLLEICPAVAEAVWRLAAIQLSWLNQGMAELASLSAHWQWQPVLAGDGWFRAGLGLVALAWFLPRGLGLRPGATVLTGALLLAQPKPFEGLSVAVLDVGQGLAVVVRAEDKTLVYDTGPRYSERFDAGSAILAPYLRHQGVSKVDLLVVSHGDNDHAGGLGGLWRHWQPKRVVSGEPGLSLPDGTRAERCRAGQNWQWGDVRFRFLHPADTVARDDNNRSCVLAIAKGDVEILLPGDVGGAVERQLLPLHGGANSTLDLLVAAHHGSRTSSHAGFVAATRPRHVVFSAGFNHAYGHPHPKVVARYQAVGSHIWSTADSGALLFHWHEGHLNVSRWRHHYLRYWSQSAP